jgi:hypothetical protein
MRKHIILLLIAFASLMPVSSVATAQSARPSVSAAEVNGTFRMNFTGKFKDVSNEIKILALGGGKLRTAMDLIYPYVVNGEMSANMGYLDGEASIKGDTAVFESNEFGKCRITINFVKAGTIKVTQEGSDSDCGFGHNVFSQGTYRKVSGKKPTFEER